MASYFPPRSSLSLSSRVSPGQESEASLSPRISPVRQDGELLPRQESELSSRLSSYRQEQELSPRLSSYRQEQELSPRSPRSQSLLSQRASSVKRVVRKIAHDKIKSNDWNLVLDDLFKHLKKHGITTKLIDSLKELQWETVHHVLKRALIISAVRWEVKHVMAIFVIVSLLKDRFGSEIEEVKQEFKSKVRELIQNEELLEELKDHLL